MKKKYTRCSASLFIGLLSLHTLSSCVNTRQTLGANGTNIRSIISRTFNNCWYWNQDEKIKIAFDKSNHKLKHTKEERSPYCYYCNMEDHESKHIPPNHIEYPYCPCCKPWYTKTFYQAAAGITATALFGAGLFYYYMLSASDLMEGTAANATTALASTAGTAVGNRTNTTLASIRNITTTMPTLLLLLHQVYPIYVGVGTTGVARPLIPNRLNSNSSRVIQFKKVKTRSKAWGPNKFNSNSSRATSFNTRPLGNTHNKTLRRLGY